MVVNDTFGVSFKTFCSSALLLSCGDNESGDLNSESSRAGSELAFSEYRDVEQARGQWRHAENSISPIRRLVLLQTALASRCTATRHST